MKTSIAYLVKRVIVIGALSVALGAPLHAQNLLINPDFQDGNTGFSTDYENYYASGNTYTPTGSYTVGTNPMEDAVPGDAWASIGDHTTGTGNMLMIDSDALGNRFWYETVSVAPDTIYTFSYWATSTNTTFNTSPAQLQLSINGLAVGPTDTLAYDSTGVTATTWVNYTETWNSGSNTTATVALSNTNTGFGYNDLAIDDVSFSGTPVVPTPEPSGSALLMLGASFLVGTFLRRLKKA